MHEPVALDTSVLLSARGGEGPALRRVYEQLSPAVLGYARGQRVEDPEALTNETMHRAFEGLGDFEGSPERFRSFVFTIAHNLIVDDHRRRARRPRTVELDGTHAQPNTTDVVDLVTTRAETMRVLALIEELTPDQRAIVLLRLVADLPIAEVADIVGKRQGAVKALHRRGLAALRRRLDEQGVSPTTATTFTQVP